MIKVLYMCQKRNDFLAFLDDVWSKIRLNQWIGNCNEEIGDHIKENQWTWQIYCKGYERNKE